MVSRSRFEELVTQHRISAFNLAYWILQNREDAEDAVQDAFVRAFRAFDTFAGAGARAWLPAIVRNVAYSALEARKRSRNVITLSEDVSLEDGVDAVSQNLRRKQYSSLRKGSNFSSTDCRGSLHSTAHS
jgi:RNA polymerase sigma-70 factor (ECF subfamily)